MADPDDAGVGCCIAVLWSIAVELALVVAIAWLLIR